MTSRRVVYVSYDGLSDQLGQSQVLPYLFALAERGHRFEIVSFEKPGAPLHHRKALRPGVRWTALRYHKSPTVPATLFDTFQGSAAISLDSVLAGADLIHVRSYVPGLMALPVSESRGIPLLFDMRGMWADERADGGSWRVEGAIYRTVKRLEQLLLRRADAVTTLTVGLQRYLRDEYPFRRDVRAPIHVIPTCVDLERFSPDCPRNEAVAAELQGHRVLLYLGAIDRYFLPRKMAEFYLAWRRYAAPARFLVVSRQEPTEIREVLAAAGVAHELVHRSATREEVPGLIRCAEASFGMRVLKRRENGGVSLAALGTAPTKGGESLACGIPFASTPLGDIPLQLEQSPCGVVIADTGADTLDAAARELALKAAAPDVAKHARELATRWFSLARGVDAYDALYRALPARRGDGARLADAAWPPAAPGATA